MAAEHDLPYVVVPAGTRNHFALDLGADPDDVVGALACLLRRARASGRPRPGQRARVCEQRLDGPLREASSSRANIGTPKLRTVIEMLPELLGPRAEPFDLRFTDAEGSEHLGAQLLLVSNNRYELDPLGARRARGRIDKGTLGVVAVHLAPPPSRPVCEWTTPEFRVSSGGPVDVGLGRRSRHP